MSIQPDHSFSSFPVLTPTATPAVTPTVTVATSLPESLSEQNSSATPSTVLIVAVVTNPANTSDADPKSNHNLTVAPSSFLDTTTITEITTALHHVGARADEEQTARVQVPSLPGCSVLAVGLGTPCSSWPADKIRRAAGVAARCLSGVETAVTTLSELNVAAAIEGLILGSYRFSAYRSAKTAPKDSPLARIIALSSAPEASNQACRATTIATAVATARDFVNTPPSHLFPDEFARWATELGQAVGLEVDVLDDKDLAAAGFGGIIGVGKGSSRPPRLVRLIHRGADKYGSSASSPTVALVGKGITFDTGGISLKPAESMHHMTCDMGGAAAVIATMAAVAQQQLPITVIATVPMAENMPSATAQRPGDVLTQYGGTTVEVLNTDAEGRLILADAIVRACEDKPDYLIETSTLTGAQTVALGMRTPGVMGSEQFRDRVAEISQREGENAWPMPLPDEFADELKSTVADLANITGQRAGGMLAAGVYLREFVADNVQWAHIDIAGPAYNTSGPWGYTPKGGTGVPTRTLYAVLEDIAANG